MGAFGDGGAVVTNNKEIAEKVKLLRNHGRTNDGDVAGWSCNCRLDNLHAAILHLKLRQVPAWIERRREIAHIYHERLSNMPELLLPPPPETNGPYFDVFQNYEIEAEDCDRLRGYLQENGIETMIQWGEKGVHQFQALGLTHFGLPRTQRMFQRALMLPIHCELSDEQVMYVAERMNRFYAD